MMCELSRLVYELGEQAPLQCYLADVTCDTSHCMHCCFGSIFIIPNCTAAKTFLFQVVDFGCGSCHVFPYLKQIVTIEDITGVDCDRSLLEMKRFAVKPLLSDFQDRYRRKTPLTMRLFHGSLAQYDSRLCNCEAAILIEV